MMKKQETIKALILVAVCISCVSCSQLWPIEFHNPWETTAPTTSATPSTPPQKTSPKKEELSANSTVDSANVIESPTPIPSKLLKIGSQGEAVLALEKRLAELRYDVGAIDGLFDSQTRQGLLAFQKYSELKRTGTYTPETQQALTEAIMPKGRYPGLGMPRIEVDIPRQILMYFDEEGLNRVVAISSGSDRKYCEISKKSGMQVCGVAHTPRGKFRIQYRIQGWRESDLGKLYNPLYFNGGFAIHGSPSVPASNVSHGCVRISVASSGWFYATVKNGTPVIVFD